MRKLVLVAGVLALAACNSDAEVTEDDAAEEEVAEVDSAVGAYSWTDDDGNAVTGHLLEDGTTYVEVNGERQNEANWVRNDAGQVCITWEAGVSDDGEEYEAGEDCMTFGEVGEDGTLEITDSDGEVDVVTKVS